MLSLYTGGIKLAEDYAIYLRKSRADMDAEARGEGETLKRHETILLALAKKMNINITKIYREIVSGESIAARPEVQKLLTDVEARCFKGILVMEVERLARGDTMDQGLVAQTFKISGTKIITPMKIYDPNNEFDEEYFEFGLFMSRREYKTINRRLQTGRIASVKEGNYIASTAPFGYKRVILPRKEGVTLEIVPEEAEVINLIFDLYIKGFGPSQISTQLFKMGYKPRISKTWSRSSIVDILRNPVYNGKLKWGWRKDVKEISNGNIKISRPISKDFLLVKGKHPAIINDETWEKAQYITETKKTHKTSNNKVLTNPLAGLIICGKCNHTMVRLNQSNRGRKDAIYCEHHQFCGNVSSNLEVIEQRILYSLEDLMKNYTIRLGKNESLSSSLLEKKKNALPKLEKELNKLRGQTNRLHDLLEQGVYSIDTFLQRSNLLSKEISVLEAEILELKHNITEEEKLLANKTQLLPKIQHVLDVYPTCTTAEEKNNLLKTVLQKVIYTKEKRFKKGENLDDFDLVLYPKIK